MGFREKDPEEVLRWLKEEFKKTIDFQKKQSPSFNDSDLEKLFTKLFKEYPLDGNTFAGRDQGQCKDLFGERLGSDVWNKVNEVLGKEAKEAESKSASKAAESGLQTFVNGINMTTHNGLRREDPLRLERSDLISAILKLVDPNLRAEKDTKTALLIKAPPASGKTVVLQFLVDQLLRSGHSVYLVNATDLNYEDEFKKFHKLAAGTILVIDDVQKWYDHVDKKAWDGLLKINYRNIASVVAAAASDVGFSGGSTPEGFTSWVNAVDLGLTATEKASMSAKIFASTGKTVFSKELWDASVMLVSDRTRFPRLSEESSIPQVDKGPRYHIGLFRNLLQDLVDQVVENAKVLMTFCQSRTSTPISKGEVEDFLGAWVAKRSRLTKRVYGRASKPWSPEFLHDVRQFFIRGAADGKQEEGPTKKAKNGPPEKGKKQKDPLSFASLVVLGALIEEELSYGEVRYVWATKLSEEFFFATAFPRRSQYVPKSPIDFVKTSIAKLESRLLQHARESSKDGYIIEHSMQESLFDVFTATAPVRWFFCSERYIENGDETGRIDFQIGSWGIRSRNQTTSPEG